MIDKQGTNLVQITTCEGQKEVCQLYPLSPGLAITRQEGQCKLAQVFSLPVVGIIYSVRHDLCFELTMFFSSRIPDTASLVCGLCSVIDKEQKSRMSCSCGKVMLSCTLEGNTVHTCSSSSQWNRGSCDLEL